MLVNRINDKSCDGFSSKTFYKRKIEIHKYRKTEGQNYRKTERQRDIMRERKDNNTENFHSRS